jgi:hypothetical protein
MAQDHVGISKNPSRSQSQATAVHPHPDYHRERAAKQGYQPREKKVTIHTKSTRQQDTSESTKDCKQQRNKDKICSSHFG